MVWRNGEHYPDPTAGAAFQRIAREEARNEMNEGKRFERDFKASVPPDAWCNRDTRRKQERLVTDYWCYMADGSVVCPKCGNRTDRLNWAVGPRCKACGSENIIVERMDRNDTARTHKTEY